MNNVDLSKLEQYRTPANAHLFEEAAGLFQEVNGGRPDTLPLPIPRPHTCLLVRASPVHPQRLPRPQFQEMLEFKGPIPIGQVTRTRMISISKSPAPRGQDENMSPACKTFSGFA